MNRQVYLLGWGLALVALALAFTNRTLMPVPEMESKAKLVRPGMRWEEVYTIIGPPKRWLGRWRYVRAEWTGADGRIVVGFNGSHLEITTVGEVTFIGNPKPPGPLSRLRAWLGQ